MFGASDERARGWFSLKIDRLLANPDFQSLVSRLPLGRIFARRDGAAIFEILQGFVASQALAALIELGLLRRLLGRPEGLSGLSLHTGVARERLEVLLTSGVALKLLKRRRDGRYALARRGAAILGVPGLEDMIAHNRVFYSDLSRPVALLRDGGETELARFWPYVMQASAGPGADQARRYSGLMAESQKLVAEDTLRQVPLRGVRRLMDVGGGSGAFLIEALRRNPALSGILVDLPEVAPTATERLARAGLSDRVLIAPQSFREGSLPSGADAVSLVRVLYDHGDETVLSLLERAFAALAPGGRLIVSEPMSGGRRPDSATDVYFAFYTMAMGTGRVRSAARIGELCRLAGFAEIRAPRPLRSYVTSVLTCVKPG